MRHIPHWIVVGSGIVLDERVLIHRAIEENGINRDETSEIRGEVAGTVVVEVALGVRLSGLEEANVSELGVRSRLAVLAFVSS